MPRRRKGIAYCPDISVLLRDAQPTRAEMTQPDALKRRAEALDRLTKIRRHPKKLRQLSQLDRARVCIFCKLLKDRNRGRLPKAKKAKGGRPIAEHRSVLIAAHAREAVEERGEKHGSKTQAFNKVAERDGASYDHVKDIYYRAFGKDHDPDFREAVDLKLTERKRGS
jgi:hypothetical protein